jgi:hypothetical protein
MMPCWFLPASAVAIAIMIAHAIQHYIYMRGVGSDEPHCGQCRYIVRAVSSWQCPECGSDLRNVGVRTGKDQLPFALASRIVLWTVLLPGPAMILYTAVIQAVPSCHQGGWYAQLTSPIEPGVDFTFDTHGYGFEDSRTFESMTFMIDGPGRPGLYLTVYPDEMTFTATSLSDNNTREFSSRKNLSSSNLAKTLTGVSIDPSLADDIVAIVRGALDGTTPGNVGTATFEVAAFHSTNQFDPPPWIHLIGLVIGIVVWLAIIPPINRSYERALAEKRKSRETIMDEVAKSIEECSA